MKYLFKIASIQFEVNSGFEIEWNPLIAKFLCTAIEHTDYSYNLHVCDQLPIIEGKLIYQSADQQMFKNGTLESRLYFLPLYHYPMMVYQELDCKKRDIYILNDYIDNMIKPNSFNIFNALAAEKMFIEHHAFVLHSSFVVFHDYAIVFSAPSGTGKSTQADLWVKYKQAKIVNGDRTLIKKENDIWYGYGMPICGSSNICLNEKAPIKAVIYLSQHTENTIEEMPESLEIKRLISETTINFWNNEFLISAISLIEDFAKSIPMYHLACRKDEEAVNILLKKLESEL